MLTNNDNILITGGAGFIGSEFVHLAAQEFRKIVVLDALTYAGDKRNLTNIYDKIEFVKGNICDKKLVLKLLKQHNINYVINFAAESHVDNSIASPSEFIKTNIDGTYSMLEACREYYSNHLEFEQRERFRYLQISTDEVYGDLPLESNSKFSETTPYNPSSPYSASKAAADHLVMSWHRTYGLPTIITNCSNNYGQRQFPEKLIPNMIKCAVTNKAMPIYGDGKNVRDWIHVEDHCQGIYLALTKGKIGETYCLGGNAEKSNLDLVHYLCAILDTIYPKKNNDTYKTQIKFIKDRAGHDRRYAIDDQKAEKDLGFKRKHDFESGIHNTIIWYLKNTNWAEDF